MSGPLVVVGDTLLDRDVDGTAHRVSPDAPALILDEERTRDRPGGAGLAALLAAYHGIDVVLVTAIADDPAGARLTELLTAAGVQLCPIPASGGTPEKIRLRAAGQVLLRLDRGGVTPLPGDLLGAARTALDNAAGILVSDYGHGMARHPAVRAAISATRATTVWDPHPSGPAPVPGIRLATPNQAEARQFASTRASGGAGLVSVVREGNTLRRRWRTDAVAVTMGAAGAVLCYGEAVPLVVPTTAAADRDTRGAGDQFAASAAVSLSRGALISEAVQQAVAAAGRYVTDGAQLKHGSTATPPGFDVPAAARADAERVAAAVRARGGTVVATGGCFDLLHTGHVATLEAARRLGDCLIVCLNSDASVTTLKGPTRPVINQTDRARMLLALRCVDAVAIFDETTPIPTIDRLRPHIWVKGGDYATTGMREAEHLRRWGGQAVVVPYLTGRSTTAILTSARETGPG